MINNNWDQINMKIQQASKLIPGVIFTALLAIISQLLSTFIGVDLLNFDKSPISSVMLAVLIGIIINNLFHVSDNLISGISFSVKKLLKLAIILLGIRLSIGEILEIGYGSILLVAVNIFVALSLTTYLSRKLNINKNLGTLIGAGTAICGVTAIVTISPLIDAEEEETAYAIAVISIFGLMATLIYPYLAHWLFQNQPISAGIFLGASIHDTSQVTGAALIYSELFNSIKTLDVATVTKLIRNISMVFVIPYLSWRNSVNSSKEDINKINQTKSWYQHIPVFVVWFIGMSLVRWLGETQISNNQLALWFLSPINWSYLISQLLSASKFLMLMALAGVGLNTNLSKLMSTGLKPLLIGFSCAGLIGVISIAFLKLI
jgi:uncharacterized integral membrane protein (TIGR00698 family)